MATFSGSAGVVKAGGNAIAEIRSGRVIVINLEVGTRAFILSLDFNWRRTRLFLLTPRSVSMDEYFSKE